MTARATRRFFLSGAAATSTVALAGCIPDVMALGSVAGPAVATPPGYDPSLLAITTRRPVRGPFENPWFSHERTDRAQLARVTFHRPDTTLVGRAQSVWYGDWSIKTVRPEPQPLSEMLPQSIEGREVLLYVHGYRESFESSVAGAVALAEGVGFQGVPLAFSWPSRAALLDYGYDRESAMISRDAFEDTLLKLLGDGGATKVHIVAHSMGTLLTVETLRQLWARHGDVYNARLGAVVLASPDIDFDLFEIAMRRLRSMTEKITVISSTSDRALEVSRRLAGGVTRVGAATRPELERFGVRVVDATDFGGWALIRHDLFLSDADVRAVVRRAIERAR